MVLETLIGGTQGEEAHKHYKEEHGKILGLAYGLHFHVFLDTWEFFSCLVEYAVLFSTRHSCLRITSPSLGDHLEELCSSFSLIWAWGLGPPTSTMLFLQQETLCCWVCSGRFTTPALELIFQRRELPFLCKICTGGPGAYLTSCKVEKLVPIHYNIVYWGNCVIFSRATVSGFDPLFVS